LRPKAESGGRVLGEGAASPLSVSYWFWGSSVSSPSGVCGGAPTSKGFPLFSAPGMASPDTIVD